MVSSRPIRSRRRGVRHMVRIRNQEFRGEAWAGREGVNVEETSTQIFKAHRSASDLRLDGERAGSDSGARALGHLPLTGSGGEGDG